MMSALYHEDGSSFRVEIMQDPEVTDFIDTHAAILNSAFENTEMSDILRSRLQESDWMFSGFKTFHELKEAFPSLLDDNGVRKPFEQFLRDVQKIDDTYNRNYLRAEYNFAMNSAEMAARWEEFAKDEDEYYLQYRTAGDDNVRPEHAALRGVTLPRSDKFWKTYYPPNGWNCRCTVVQVLRDGNRATDHDEAMARGAEALSKDKKGMFAFNSGTEQRTFPAYNPYTISKCATCSKAKLNLGSGVPSSELCSCCTIIRNMADDNNSRESNKALFERLKADRTYTKVEFDETTGGVKATSVSHKKDGRNEEVVYKEFTGKQLESRCQDNIFRMGGTCILEAESVRVNNMWASCLDATIEGKRMDIASITKNEGNIFYNTITRKEKQILKYNSTFNSNAHCLALYFEDASLFDETKVRDALSGYRNDGIHRGVIDSLYCVINGAEKMIEIK